MSNDLDKLLSESLTSRRQPKRKGAPTNQRGFTTPEVSIVAPKNVAKRQTVHLTEHDQRLVDQIIDNARAARGARISVSEAIRIGLILAPDDIERVGKAFDTAQSLDGRRK